jgi:two-component system, cell cycle sensor histidine kinase and response regulator CckA
MNKILIVEDEAIVARDIGYQLQQLNYEPVAATATGEEALLLTERLNPDLVLMDIQLAGAMDGIMAAHTIRERFDIPVVFLTAYAGHGSVHRAKLTEPFGYLIKPLEERDLRIVIEMALYKHQADKAIRTANERLRTNEERFNHLARQSRTGIWEVDADGLYTYCNDVMSDLTGYPVEEIVGKKHFCDLHLEKGCDGFEGLASEVIARKDAFYNRENPIRTKDGGTIWVSTIGIPVLDKDGNLLRYHGSDTDITERKRAAEALLESEAKYRQLVETTTDWIWSIDMEGRYTYSNPTIHHLLGYQVIEVVGNIAFPLMHPEDEKSAREMLKRCIDQKVGWKNVMIRWLHKNGSTRSFESAARPIVNAGGKIVGFSGIDRDVTERNALEEQCRQTQKLESIGQLAGGVAHDFNNILAVMMMRMNFLQQNNSLDPESLETVSELTMDAKRSASLTKQLLLFSRRSVMEVELLDLNELVTNLLKMLRRLIGEHITVRFNRCEDLPAVEADTVMLEQVIMNLSVNARDAMPQGGGLTICIEPVHVDEERARGNIEARQGQFVCLSVADTGCGMAEVTRKRIFEPFFTTKGIGKGTGLGLATVHGIVAQHKGWVEVESELGKGTTFRVFLPAKQGRAEPTTTEKMSVIRGHETILLVEDEASLRRLVAQGLRQIGYSVLEADNGQSAMKLWQEHGQQIDLLFSDMLMPEGLTGLDLVERIKPEKPNLKVIISSGYNAEIAGKTRPNAEGIVYFSKPYEFEVLSKTIRNCLDRA